jgi:hypothetical protein
MYLLSDKPFRNPSMFADGIMRMEEDDKVLFLVFPYISDELDVKLVEKIYESIIVSDTRSNQKYFMNFERVKKWFEGDKINISDNKIGFSHPSYHEAFEFAISSEKRESARVKDIFVKVMSKVVQEDKTARYLAHAIAENFDKLPNNVQQLLFEFAEKDNENNFVVGWAIAESFDKLPASIREQLLLKIADKDSVAGIVSSIMKERGNNIPEHIEKEILVKLNETRHQMRKWLWRW